MSVIVLYVVSVALPLWGVWGLVAPARAEGERRRELSRQRGFEGPTEGELAGFIRVAWERPSAIARAAVRDLWLIGGGLVAGATAGVWSLFI